MESVIDIILRNRIESKELIFWLNSSIQVSLLNDYEQLKHDFVPSFLNFLREESSSFLHSTNHTGLTPCKFTSNVRISKNLSPDKLSRKSYSNKGYSSKAKTLDFSQAFDMPNNNFNKLVADVSPDSPAEFLESSGGYSYSLRTPKKKSPQLALLSLNESPVSLQSFRTYSTSTPRIEQQKTHPRRPCREKNQGNDYSISSFVRMSERKNVLADYILNEPSAAKKSLKKRGGRESLKEWNYQTHFAARTKQQQPELNIDDKEAFPIIGCGSTRKNQKKKRINPTRVATSPSQNSSDNSVVETNCRTLFGVPRKQTEQNVFLMATETKAKSLDQERKLLKEQRERLIKDRKGISRQNNVEFNSPDNSNTSSPPLASSPNTTDEGLSVSRVTSQDELNVLAEIYSSLIIYNMVSNIMVELYFILQLLTIEVKVSEPVGDSVSETTFLNSCHNCVYFAVKTLYFLTDCLALFDRGLVRSLSENVRILSFDAHLREKLGYIMETSHSAKPSITSHPKSPILSVSFQSETDNRNNFPNTTAFHMFRKQRDLFYEILRVWEDSHLIPGWSFAQGLGTKVRQILTLHSESTNLTHLARLFKSQLLTMCKGDEQVTMQQKDSEDTSFLFVLKKQNPEKYKRLYERLITPSKFGGPVPTPSFPGSQEFFRDFIVTAASHTFNVHLKNVLVSKVVELNDLQWQITDMEEKEQQGEHLRDQVTSALTSLRLLAKFLGFLEFLPYQTSEAYPDIVISNHSMLRHKVVPPIPLLEMLKEGILSGSLVIVVPWMVELLSMADPVAFHTRYYLTLIYGLILIYKALYIFKFDVIQDPACTQCGQANELRTMSEGNSFLLKLALGWLLSLPNVPEGLFYLREEEVDLDETEYEAVKRILASNYARVCPECLCSLSLADIECIEDSVVSPIKANDTGTPVKSIAKTTPLKEKGDGFSPLKTPSKFLRVSMIDTPEVTPDKQNQDVSNSFSKCSLDSYSLIDCNALVAFCPFILELKGLLNDFALGHSRSSNGGGNVRKITPFSATEKTGHNPEKAIQMLLEENFFHNQPSSAKKTVDFVIERIFSNVLRSVRSFIIPSLKDECVSQLRACVSSTVGGSPTVDKAVELVDKKVYQLSSELSSQVQQEVMDRTTDIIGKENLKTSMRFLLPMDMTENSLEMCCKIVERSVQTKVTVWVSSHLTTGFCTKELTTEAHKYVRQIQKVLGNENVLGGDVSNANVSSILNTSMHNNSITHMEDNESELTSNTSNTVTDAINRVFPVSAQCHNEAATCPSALLYEIKVDLRMLMFSSEESSLVGSNTEVERRLRLVRDTVTGRGDVTLPIYKALETVNADWMAAMCVCLPHLVTGKTLKAFCKLWLPSSQGGIFSKTSTLTVFLSPRTIMLLGKREEKEQELAWRKLEDLLVEMIMTAKVMDLSMVQESCIFLMRHSWPQNILDCISKLIKNFLERLKKDKDFQGNCDIVQLMDWIGWAACEINNVDDDRES